MSLGWPFQRNEEFAPLMRDVVVVLHACRGLIKSPEYEYVHRGVRHLKPSYPLCREEGRVMILDVGGLLPMPSLRSLIGVPSRFSTTDPPALDCPYGPLGLVLELAISFL